MQCGVGISASEFHTPICSGSLDATLRWFIHIISRLVQLVQISS